MSIRKEPVKYVKNDKGNWILTEEWKEWHKSFSTQIVRRKSVDPPRPVVRTVTAETHIFHWKVVAWYLNGNKRIMFCACKAGQGADYAGCGAVGIQNTPQSDIKVVVNPTFK